MKQLALNLDAPPGPKSVREMSREEYRAALVESLERRLERESLDRHRGLRLVHGGRK